MCARYLMLYQQLSGPGVAQNLRLRQKDKLVLEHLDVLDLHVRKRTVLMVRFEYTGINLEKALIGQDDNPAVAIRAHFQQLHVAGMGCERNLLAGVLQKEVVDVRRHCGGGGTAQGQEKRDAKDC
jgi:hypothetical protein